MSLAPVTLFVYNRFDHTKKTIEALQKNKLATESDLIIFSDGPKNDSTKDEVNKVRDYLKTVNGFKSVSLIEREKNFGLAQSIINGVTDVVSRYGKIIVLEDDLISSPYFLQYMNQALDLYESTERVISIHGYIYPVKNSLPETFFLRGADCWGWATWERGWNLFEADGQKLLTELKNKKLERDFNWDNAYPFTQMLRGQIKGFNNSWAIRWHASAFIKDKLTLYPGRPLIINIGFDNSGTHSSSRSAAVSTNSLSNRPIIIEKQTAVENQAALQVIKKYFNAPKLKLITTVIRLKFFINIIKNIVK